jgi:membrane fusion protein (multidrug efflux system)
MPYSRRKKRLYLGFGSVLILVFIFLIGSGRYLETVREKRRYAEERDSLQPPPPNIHEVQKATHPRLRRYTAELRPWMVANVPATISGRVVETTAEPGQVVAKGDVLIRLDDTRARIAVDAATAKHQEALRLLDEARRLRTSNVVSETALQAAEAEARFTDAQLREARDTLQKHEIRAPFYGEVNLRHVDVGDAINANEPLVEVVDLARLRVIFYLSEQELAGFKKGMPFRLEIPSRPDIQAEPRLEFLGRSADPVTRLFRAEAVLDNTKWNLPGGLQGLLEAQVELFADLPVVPAAAVRFTGRKALVLLDQGKEEPEWTEITVGPEVNGVFPVFQGLHAGDKIWIR